ncbi:hypothetical protein AB0O47_40150, partial [Streptomyces noursei]|uniref:hypothetical protein n=1 Tax=Streptomyces noursei TaxID=1971 RepID=UPI00344CA57B
MSVIARSHVKRIKKLTDAVVSVRSYDHGAHTVTRTSDISGILDRWRSIKNATLTEVVPGEHWKYRIHSNAYGDIYAYDFQERQAKEAAANAAPSPAPAAKSTPAPAPTPR